MDLSPTTSLYQTAPRERKREREREKERESCFFKSWFLFFLSGGFGPCSVLDSIGTNKEEETDAKMVIFYDAIEYNESGGAPNLVDLFDRFISLHLQTRTNLIISIQAYSDFKMR